VKFAKILRLAFLLGWFIGMILDKAGLKNLVYMIAHLVKVRK